MYTLKRKACHSCTSAKHLVLDNRVTCSKRLPCIKETLETLLARTEDRETPDIAPVVAAAAVMAPSVIAISNAGSIAPNLSSTPNETQTSDQCHSSIFEKKCKRVRYRKKIPKTHEDELLHEVLQIESLWTPEFRAQIIKFWILSSVYVEVEEHKKLHEA